MTSTILDTNTSSEQQESLTILPDLREAIEDLVQTIYGYEDSDATAPDTVTDAQAIAALAIRNLQEGSAITEAINLWNSGVTNVGEATEDAGL